MTNSPPPSYVHNIHSVGVDFSVAQHTLLGSRPAQERPVRLVLQQLSGLLPAWERRSLQISNKKYYISQHHGILGCKINEYRLFFA